MPRIYKEKDNYYFKIPAYIDMEQCEINNNQYNETNVPKYSDVPESIFSIMCSTIIDFVEQECPLEIIDWDWSKDHSDCRDEFMKLYKWAKVWPKYRDRIEKQFLINDWEGGGIHDMWFVYENKLTQLEDQFMIRLINIRMGLWT